MPFDLGDLSVVVDAASEIPWSRRHPWLTGVCIAIVLALGIALWIW